MPIELVTELVTAPAGIKEKICDLSEKFNNVGSIFTTVEPTKRKHQKPSQTDREIDGSRSMVFAMQDQAKIINCQLVLIKTFV